MSRIDKLAILGIRSFDNTRSETIQFGSPLTLIVGYNGSGKTTIIECLKYATTGDLPPNSRSGAFIHDPKICGEKEVLAQIKLSFNSTSDAKMVCTRSIQLTVRKSVRQQKSLEGQLLVVRNGERSTISSRCAELDLVMPQYLGVSKAVLEYVIFCHQDESLWPMSEPSVLKKRFDEIFEALKYTRAIDNIKALRKKQNEELTKQRVLLEQYRIDKDRGEKANRRADVLHDEIEALRPKVEEMIEEIKKTAAQQKELMEGAKGFEETLAIIASKEAEIESRREHIKEMSQHLTHYKESNEELGQMQREYGERMATFARHIEGRKRNHRDVVERLGAARKRQHAKLAEHGQFKAEKDNHEKEHQSRAQMITDIGIKHGIKGFDGDLDESQINNFIAKISKMTRDQNTLLERIKRENKDQMAAIQDDLNELNGTKASLLQKKEYSQQEIINSDERARGFQRQLLNLGVDVDQETAMREKLKSMETRLLNAKAEFEKGEFDSRLQSENSRIKVVEEQLEEATEALSKGTRQANDRAKLELVRTEMNNKQKSLDSLLATKRELITRLLGADWNVESLEQDSKAMFNLREDDVEEATRVKDGTSQLLSRIDAKINVARDQLKKKNEEAKRCERIVLESFCDEDGNDPTDANEYPRAAADFEERVTQTRGENEHGLKYLQRALKTLEDEHVCFLCRRGFENKEEAAFTRSLRRKVEQAAKNAAHQEIQEAEDDLKAVREARPAYDSWVRLKKEIPELQQDIEKQKKSRDSLASEYANHEQRLNECINARTEARSLKDMAMNIVNYTNDIAEYKRQADEVSSTLSDMGNAQTIEEIRTQIQQLSEEAKGLRKRIKTLADDKELKRRAVSTIEEQVRDAHAKLGELKIKLEQSRSLSARVDECRATKIKQNENVKQVNEEISRLTPAITRKVAELQEVASKGTERENKQQRDASKLAHSEMALQNIQKRISSYLNRGGAQQLETSESHLATVQEEVDDLAKQEVLSAEEIVNLQKEESSADATKKSIAENLRYRKSIRDLERIMEDIKQLDGRKALEQKSEFTKHLEILSNKHMRLSGEKSALAAEMRQKDIQLQQLIGDYLTDYADAKDKYRSTLAKVQMTTAASDDLAKYSAALDKAIMKYHSLKMEEINRIADELWKATYRGTDVDTILIRSDTETGKANRSYNYRVCMIKQDAEMDMRGRCSAGQRVLACIIIRLALAECFGVNCGLFALDEPTTNLDSDNVKSLARSLHEIIQTRQVQSNFQLIVITHDEDFLKEMRCEDYCDHYYRVSRDDRQKSIIEKQSIVEVI